MINYKAIETVAKTVSVKKFVINKAHKRLNFPNDPKSLDTKKMELAKKFISKWSSYTPTKLRELTKVADFCGVKAVYYKDESTRLGLGSFKALGGAYAVKRLVEDKKSLGVPASSITVATATDGNHGRSVAWGARAAGCKSKIFIHANVSKNREMAMTELGAEVFRVEGNYEDSLEECNILAEENGWSMVSDTSWGQREETPLRILAGYSLIADEALVQMGKDKPTHTFLPVGCGGLAAAIVARLWDEMGKNIGKVISVESAFSSCLLESVEAEMRTCIDTEQETVMAGLSCGEVSVIAWKILRQTLTHCISLEDCAVAPIMKLFANRGANGHNIEAGECSTAGLAAFLSAQTEPKIAAAMDFDKDSIIFLIGTEGATDREIYDKLLKA